MILVSTKCHQASDLWQQLELASELESDLRLTVYWTRKYRMLSVGRHTPPSN